VFSWLRVGWEQHQVEVEAGRRHLSSVLALVGEEHRLLQLTSVLVDWALHLVEQLDKLWWHLQVPRCVAPSHWQPE
jgi:hypothetical protein